MKDFSADFVHTYRGGVLNKQITEKGRLLVLGIHNSDHSDGWEREGEYKYYFSEFSEKRAFPLGINTSRVYSRILPILQVEN